MSQVNNHKLVLLKMMQILLTETDEEHTLNAAQLIRQLKAAGLEADRRTIYGNIEVLRDFGLDVIKDEGSNTGGYYIGSREFDLAELKLLVDAVQSSKFITEKKSEELIKKLGSLTSSPLAGQLNREVYIRNRMKAGNEKIYYNVDAVYDALNSDKQVSFQYAEWTPQKRLAVKKDGKEYVVSPWALTWDNENYYLIAFDEKEEKIKHFRVDKILKLSVLDAGRNGQEAFKGFDLAAFSKKTFGMYGGEEYDVTLRCINGLAGVVIDRFGKDVKMLPDGEGYFRMHAPVSVSRQFFGWVTGIGNGIEIEGPEPVRQAYQAYLEEILGQYRSESSAGTEIG